MKEVLLLDKETETKQDIKIKLKTEKSVEKKDKELAKKLFSTPVKEEVIEKPNFDKIEELSPEKRKKIFKVSMEKEEKQKFRLNKKLKMALIGIVMGMLLIFCITSTIEIVKLNAEVQQAQSNYNASLTNLIQKIYSTETGNRSLNLFETFPEENLGASSFYESSNWFDRICNFLTGIFGG